MNVNARFTYNGPSAKQARASARPRPVTPARPSNRWKPTTPSAANVNVESRSTSNENPNTRQRRAPYQVWRIRLAPVHGRNRTTPSVQRMRLEYAYDQSSLRGKSPRNPM